MELKDYWQILKKNLAFIVFLALLGALFAYLLTSNFSGGQRVQKHYLLIEEQAAGEGFESPVIFKESVDLTDTAVLNLQAEASERERAFEIIKTAAENFNGMTASLFGQNEKIKLTEIGESFESLRPAFDKKITTAFGFLLGAAFAIFAVGLKTYFKL